MLLVAPMFVHSQYLHSERKQISSEKLQSDKYHKDPIWTGLSAWITVANGQIKMDPCLISLVTMYLAPKIFSRLKNASHTYGAFLNYVDKTR